MKQHEFHDLFCKLNTATEKNQAGTSPKKKIELKRIKFRRGRVFINQGFELNIRIQITQRDYKSVDYVFEKVKAAMSVTHE